MFDWAGRAFSLDEGEDTLRSAFETVELVRLPVTSTVIITDADVVAVGLGPGLAEPVGPLAAIFA